MIITKKLLIAGLAAVIVVTILKIFIIARQRRIRSRDVFVINTRDGFACRQNFTAWHIPDGVNTDFVKCIVSKINTKEHGMVRSDSRDHWSDNLDRLCPWYIGNVI